MPEELEDQMFEFLEATDFVDDGEGLVLANAQYSDESVYFAQQVIEAACEDDDVEVDFEKRIIYKLHPECANQIAIDVLGSSAPLINMINTAFDGGIANVELINGENSGDAPAFTDPIYFSADGSNFLLTIQLDNDYLAHATDFSIAAAILHEMVHAYLINLYLTGAMQAGDTDYDTLLNTFVNFYNNPDTPNYTAADNEIHNTMQLFIEKLSTALFEYAQLKNMNGVTCHIANNWFGAK